MNKDKVVEFYKKYKDSNTAVIWKMYVRRTQTKPTGCNKLESNNNKELQRLALLKILKERDEL